MAWHKPILCLDFDGVLHSYESGWQGIDVVADGPTPGMAGFLADAIEDFEVCVVSSRSQEASGREAMQEALLGWLTDECGMYDGTTVFEQIRFPEHKPAAFLTIDDRALTFEGTFPRPADLLSFKPWNKKG